MSPTVTRRWERALRDDQPVLALRDEIVRRLTREHVLREDVRIELTEFSQYLKRRGRQADDESVLNVLDMLDGWCSPQLTLTGVGKSEDD